MEWLLKRALVWHHIDQLRTRYGHLNTNEDTVTDNDLDNWTFLSSVDTNITFTPTNTLSTNSPSAQS